MSRDTSLAPSHALLRRLATAIALIVSLWLPASHCLAQEAAIIDESVLTVTNPLYLSVNELPNAVRYLPMPPDTASAQFADDFVQWQWGKSVRGTTRGIQASRESDYGLNRLVIIMGPLIGISMTSSRTPSLINLIWRVGETASRSTQQAKLAYQRRRPFQQMGEHTWGMYDNEEELADNGSFPSAHAAYAWGVGLVLAEMFPEKQDTILSRAYQYGESRVIVGAHWQSDVDAARLTAATAVARMHACAEFQTDFEAAREEYYTVRAISEPDHTDVGLPTAKRYLGAPVNETSTRFLGDVARYWELKTERTPAMVDQAAIDITCTTATAMLREFSIVTGEQFTEEQTPELFDVVRYTCDAIAEATAEHRQASPHRPKPYVQVGEQPAIADTDSVATTLSCYPCDIAALGWGVALALTEIMPEYQHALLSRGYDFGYNAVMAGECYTSDAQASREIASAVLARLHARPEYKLAVAGAWLGRQGDPIITQVREVITESLQHPGYWYTISGQRINSEPKEHGIFIHNGERILR